MLIYKLLIINILYTSSFFCDIKVIRKVTSDNFRVKECKNL